MRIFVKQTTKKRIMTTIKNDYARIEFNGSKTYMVIDSANQCLFATTSERKAKNFFNRLLKNICQ